MLTFILLSCASLINTRHVGENGQPPPHNPAIETLGEDQSLEVDVPSEQDIIALCLKNDTWVLCISADEESEGKLNLNQESFDKPVSIQDMRFVRLCLQNGKRSPCVLFEGETQPDGDDEDIMFSSEFMEAFTKCIMNFASTPGDAAKEKNDAEDERLTLCLKNNQWSVCPSTDEDHEGFVNICHKNDRWSLCQSPDKEDEIMFDAPFQDFAVITLCHKNDEWSVCTGSEGPDDVNSIDFVETCLRNGKWGQCPPKESDDFQFPTAYSENGKWSFCHSKEDENENILTVCRKDDAYSICQSVDDEDEIMNNTPAEDMGIVKLCVNDDKLSVCLSAEEEYNAEETFLVVACLRNGQWGRCLQAEEEHFKIHSEDEGIFQMCLKNKKWSLCHPPTEESEGVIMLCYKNGKWSPFLSDDLIEHSDKISPVEGTSVFKLCLKNGKWSVCLSAEEEKEADDIAVFPLCRRKGIWLLHLTAEQERSR
ncbi:hypothetical protein BLNAU_19878 [Blattamonas nauphoetae]|uniref:Uncharacterized protein n=1 Tax=Blattamonas nauphoetae TaxID=2049346 RepID=A0ABQ9X1G4_9EUKA|nr:hypothetical protein BLNAU_19878 [Blattamonas nauphoetae]